jgi:hypothetical protein
MDYLDKIYNLDWGRYNKLLYNSISFQYFPKEDLKTESEQVVEVLYELEGEKVIYIPISKNASTSVLNSLNFTPVNTCAKNGSTIYSGIDWLDIPQKYKNGYKFFIITRDPKERWISGINEFLNIYHHEGVDFNGGKKGSYSKFLTELKNNKFIFDCHTRPQVSWINFCFQYDFDMTFLKLDENLNDKISSFLKRPVTMTHDNPTKKYKYKLKNYKFCYDVLTEYCMKNKNFLDLHEMDFYLYDNSI